MSDPDYRAPIVNIEALKAENDRLRSQLEGCEERLREAVALLAQGNYYDESLAGRALTALREGREP